MASELRGVGELTAKLLALGVEVAGKNMRSAARESMKIAYNYAQATIPVWQPPENSRGYHKTYKGNIAFPGYAQRHLRLASAIDKRNGVIRAVLGVSKEAYYTVQFVEFGTSRQPAQPWLRNSLEVTQNQVLSALTANIKKRLEKIAKQKAAGVPRGRRTRRLG